MDNETLLGRLQSHQDNEAAPTDEMLAKREIATQLRALADAIGDSRVSATQMREVAEQLAAQCAILAASDTATGGDTQETPSNLSMVAGMEDFRDRSPVTGLANPMAPPASLRVDLESERVVGEMTFGRAYEGAPGIVHGGFVAAALDEALGMACIFSGGPAMTAELTTRYRQHTPVSTPLRIEARLVSVDGRKIRTAGEVYDGDLLIAEGSGLFITVDVEKFARLAAAKSERAAS